MGDLPWDASISEAVVVGTDAPAPGVGVWGTRFLPICGLPRLRQRAPPPLGRASPFFTRAENSPPFICVGFVHDAGQAGGAAHGMSAFGLESARMRRTLAPQTGLLLAVATVEPFHISGKKKLRWCVKIHSQPPNVCARALTPNPRTYARSHVVPTRRDHAIATAAPPAAVDAGSAPLPAFTTTQQQYTSGSLRAAA